MEFRFGWSSDLPQSMARAIELANQSLAMDDKEAVAHSLLGFLRLLQGRHDASLASMRKAISLEPNSSLFAAIHANALIYSGQPEEALVTIEKAMRLSPFYPAWYVSVMSLAYHRWYPPTLGVCAKTPHRPNLWCSHERPARRWSGLS